MSVKLIYDRKLASLIDISAHCRLQNNIFVCIKSVTKPYFEFMQNMNSKDYGHL